MHERLKALCKEQGITITQLERDCGISAGYLCKIDKHKPNAELLKRVATALNTTVAYLMGDEEEMPFNFDPKHLDMIEMFESLTEEDKDHFMAMLSAFANKYK